MDILIGRSVFAKSFLFMRNRLRLCVMAQNCGMETHFIIRLCPWDGATFFSNME